MQENNQSIRSRPSWDETFLREAKVIAERSPDPDYQVGCVIVNQENVVVGMGYNGAPRGINPEIIPWDSEDKHYYVCHAELNAILNANGSVKGCKIYTVLFPCCECMKAIIQSGIREVYYEDDSKIANNNPKFLMAKVLADQAGVVCTKI